MPVTAQHIKIIQFSQTTTSGSGCSVTVAHYSCKNWMKIVVAAADGAAVGDRTQT